MKVAIYCRVSKRDMHPENQRRQLEDFAKRNNWQYDIYEEKETSRKTRPIKEMVLSKLRQREYDGVLVWKLDRWARSMTELSLEITELAEKGLNFASLMDNIDLSTATGKLQFHIICAFAEFERDLIRERTLAGLDRARAEGKRIGRHPKGCNCGKCKQK
jgi:putative DNA-invertase from lambdoid prophage Rac